ncbi:MAG: diaminopimelate epimerase, partial [Shimia sp.]
MAEFPFLKMHGLGNDFVVIDTRDGTSAPSEGVVRAMADRHRGVGFDQLAVISAPLQLTFYNADGSTSAACGNATRCIADREFAATGAERLELTTDRGTLHAVQTERGPSINMGAPQLDWREVPLAEEVDTLSLPIQGEPVATGMGNPHCTFFVDDVEAIDLATQGAAMEHHPLFPNRTNVQFAQIIGPDHIRM